ncbi:glycosyltransferase family 2 protein [Paragemmobacter straminiformis]|uniref:Glycosyltransferase family 2 protein n=1 Tax=Paragemmobacter straminiformis TaxID=2045119 RepID=A0A842IC15_9RHOB|nr:glycosyltransferase family 2 protein [Gemmobacter straminiformis]MBC2836654.1 glycosyltransferase family 2 protein [Gemmobacter straminiformis]
MDVDVSLTTIAARIGQVDRVIASILSQKPAPARVILHLSAGPWLLDTGIAAVPPALQALADAGRIELRFGANTGPYRKILPWLGAHFGSDRMVVTADDDTVYPQGWLAGLLAAWRPGVTVAHSAHAIALRDGAVAPYGQWFKAPVTSSQLLLPIGKDGVLYRASDFPAEVLDTAAALRLAPTGDDLWLRWHQAWRGVPVVVAGQGKLADAGQGDSLWRSYNRAGGNDATIAALEAHFRASYGFTMAGPGPA